MKFPQIMGIVNVTPDSFSDGSRFFTSEDAVRHALTLVDDGADILDIGGESTKPGSEPVAEAEELRRIIPVIVDIRKENSSIPISIDTTKYNVAKAAMDVGATIINDVSALRTCPEIAVLAAKRDIPLILMHIRGTPKNMQISPEYDDVVSEIYSFLEERIEFSKAKGVRHIIADVGIGFGKTVEHNLDLLKNIGKFKGLGVPLLLGISRKAFIGKLLNIEKPGDRDIPTAMYHALLLASGVDIIRVHNVRLIKQLKEVNISLS